MMKSKKFKRTLMISAVSVAVIAAVSTVAGIMLPSYVEWKKYYDSAISDREYQKYLNSLPLEFLGISAQLSSGTIFFDNGKANPINDDFQVIAHFTEKGRDFDEILQSDDFTITVPENFATAGGDIEFSYTFVPEAKDDETPTPITKTTVLTLSLTDVIPQSIEITENPYRVYYREGTDFDIDGMNANLVYNDGSKQPIKNSEITVENGTKLVKGTEKVVIKVTKEGKTISKEVPITVVSDSEYDDGALLRLVSDKTVEADEGTKYTEINPDIRGEYASGNRLLVSKAEISISSNIDTAILGENMILTVRSVQDINVACKVPVMVKKTLEAENGTTTSPVVEHDNYGYDEDGQLTLQNKVKSVDLTKDGTINFEFDVSTYLKPNFSIVLNNPTDTSLQINDALEIQINDVVLPIGSDVKSDELNVSKDNKFVFESIELPKDIIYRGKNTLKLTSNIANLSVDKLEFSMGYTGKLYANVEQLLVESAEQNQALTFETDSTWFDWYAASEIDLTYGHSMCTDGKYIYYTSTSYSTAERNLQLLRIDMETKEVIGSETISAFTVEDSANVTLYKDKVIVFSNSGIMKYINTSEFTNGATFKDFDEIAFPTIENDPIIYFQFNDLTKQFVVRTLANKIRIYNEDFSEYKSLSISVNRGSIKRVYATNNYIYVMTSQNGMYSPDIYIYDYQANFVGSLNLPVSESDMGATTTILTNSNAQGICVIGDDIYLMTARWGQDRGDTYKIIKYSTPSGEKSFTTGFTLGEYVSANMHNQSESKFTFDKFTYSSSEAPGYSMGVCSDGKYIYYATNTSGNANAVVYKTLNGKIVAYTDTLYVGGTSDNARLFIKGDTLYLIGINGQIYSLKLDQFNENRVPLTLDNSLPFSNVEAGAFSAYYESTVDKYAVLDKSRNISILNGDGTVVKTFTPKYPSLNASSVSGDSKYFYVSYCINSQSVLPIDIYKWDGTKVSTIEISGINLGNNAEGNPVNFNIQCIAAVEDGVYATITSWDNGYQKLTYAKISFDINTLN